MKSARFASLIVLLWLSACTSVPEGIEPVRNFELDKYLGTWYEVARLDHSFEQGLSQVTANYSLRDDGGVQVINRGWNQSTGEWEEAQGKAFFVETPDIGHLKVSFFGPFYASYVIFELDQPDYQYALITGPDRDYFWLLSRQPVIPKSLQDELVTKAKNAGFNTDELIYIEQSVTADD